MKKVLSLVLCCLTVSIAFGQQDKQFTHYMFDRMSFNPATTGFKGYCGTLIYRNQWDRVQDAPNTTLFNAQGNLQKYNVGVGLSFTNDAIGFTRNNTLTINGAYHYPTPFGTLSGGIGIGIINVGFSPKWIPPTTDFDANIPLVPISGTGFDVNLGFFWQADNYYAGISTTHLAPADLDKVSYSVARHYYVYGGYNLKLSDITGWSRRVDLKPSTLIKADGSTMVFDLNVTSDVWMNSYSYFWGGVSYRYIDAVALMVGYGFSPKANTNLDMFKFGYSFDIMTNKLNTYGKGTHELMVNYCMFPPAPTVARHGNPFILQ